MSIQRETSSAAARGPGAVAARRPTWILPAVAAAAFLLVSTGAGAQQAGGTGTGTQQASTTTSGEITIEELFLKSVEFQILREKAFSDDFDVKMSALDDLEKKVADGSYKANDQQVEFVLEYLAMEGSGHMVREDGKLVNNFPEVRRRAANMLGRIGTDAARDALIRVLLIDDEPTVKAEAAYALGVMGKNPDNQVIQALAFTYNQEDPSKPDNNFGYALCLAVEKIAQSTPGGVKDPAAYQMLVKIAQGNYLRTVRTKALQVLDELKTPAQ
jgi:HEAT repeat protein